MKKDKSFIALAIPVLVILVAVAFLTIHHKAPKDNVFTGMFETTTVNVASLDPGRVDSMFVEPGDTVRVKIARVSPLDNVLRVEW